MHHATQLMFPPSIHSQFIVLVEFNENYSATLPTLAAAVRTLTTSTPLGAAAQLSSAVNKCAEVRPALSDEVWIDRYHAWLYSDHLKRDPGSLMYLKVTSSIHYSNKGLLISLRKRPRGQFLYSITRQEISSL